MNNIIDCHVHITESGKWFNTKYDSSMDTLLHQMDRSNVKKSILLPIRGEISNSFVKKICSSHKDRFIGFGNLSAKTWKTDLNEILDFNLKGIKFHPRIQNETILDWAEVGILEEVQKQGLPILICGWQQTSSINANMSKIHPLVVDEIAKQYKDLKIVIAHLGGHRFLDAFFCARSNPNVFLDSSYFFNFFKNTSLEKDALILLNKIDEKVLFGSDFPEVSIKESADYLIEQAEKYEFNLSKIMTSNIFKLIRDE
jgi:predicted TIM-barrel fold metal-dependent hydrolase